MKRNFQYKRAFVYCIHTIERPNLFICFFPFLQSYPFENGLFLFFFSDKIHIFNVQELAFLQKSSKVTKPFDKMEFYIL